MARCRNHSGFALRGGGHAEDFTFCAMNRSPLWPGCLEPRQERPALRGLSSSALSPDFIAKVPVAFGPRLTTIRVGALAPG